MTEQNNTPEQKMGIVISYLLRLGVTMAAMITLTGGVFYLVQSGLSVPSYGVFHGEPSTLRDIPDIAASALAGHARAIMQLGLLVLIATPIARVLFSVFAFLLERDYLYVIVTLIVLAILVLSYIVL